MESKPVRVLVVDDERSIRISAKAFLEDAGYEVSVAEESGAALELLRAERFDVVVSDIILPGASGVMLLRKIREASTEIEVIMMTGEPTVESATEAVRAGASDYLEKPVGKRAILDSVRKAALQKTMRDEIRRLETENRRYQERLEELVEERTRQLSRTMEELSTAQREIIRHERLNALAQLAAGISHDFNNALMPILGLTDFMLHQPGKLDDPAETARFLRIIDSAATDAAEIVRRMQEFYRPREESFAARSVRVSELFSSVIDLTRPKWEVQAQREGRLIEVAFDAEDEVEIRCDAAQLREALINLVLNAADALPVGGCISLAARRVDGSTEIAVSDDGVGMSEETRRRCIEPFFTTKGEAGTGMGLAMVHGIVARHNGLLELESEVGRGTRVRVIIPDEEGIRPVGVEESPVSESPARRLSILVIDDDEVTRMVVGRYLTDAGHSVLLVPDGAAGVGAVLEHAFDLVITDRTMPGMSGDEVAAIVKRRVPGLPVVLLTGNLPEEDHPVPADLDAVLRKPVTQRQVIELVNRITRRGERTTADGS